MRAAYEAQRTSLPAFRVGCAERALSEVQALPTFSGQQFRGCWKSIWGFGGTKGGKVRLGGRSSSLITHSAVTAFMLCIQVCLAYTLECERDAAARTLCIILFINASVQRFARRALHCAANDIVP